MGYGNKSISDWAEDVYDCAKRHGFHEEKNNPFERIALIHSELSELLETFRDNPNAPCEKSIPITAAEEELADVVIRCLDFAQEFGLNIEQAIREKHYYNEARPYKHGRKI